MRYASTFSCGKVEKIIMVENFRDFSRFISPDVPAAAKIAGETVDGTGFFISRENSDMLSLEYILAGTGTLEINGQVLHPQPGDVFLLTLGSRHTYYADPDEPWRKYFAAFCGPVAESIIRNYLPADTYLFKNCNVEPYFRELVQASLDDAMPFPEKSDRVTQALLKICMYIRSRNVLEQQDLADKIRNRLDFYVEHPFSLDMICRDFNYSKNHIIHVFREKFGKTPYQYYSEVKIETAKRYLQDSSMRIGEIADLLAFSDRQYFASCFHKAVGCSPREYRNRVRNSAK